MQTGVPEYMLDALPKVKFSPPGAGSGEGSGSGSGVAASANEATDKDDFGQVSCSICLCEYEEAETLIQLPCKHRYHPDCIRQWLQMNKVCHILWQRFIAAFSYSDDGFVCLELSHVQKQCYGFARLDAVVLCNTLMMRSSFSVLSVD